MESNQAVVSALNDLVKINNDRIEGYQKAMELTDDSELKTLFQRLAMDSSKNINELSDHIFAIHGQPSQTSTMSGKFYRAWMDVKAAFTGKDRHQILADCEYGEDMALEAYQKIEEDDDLQMDYATNSILTTQKQRVLEGHNTIKRLRDATRVN